MAKLPVISYHMLKDFAACEPRFFMRHVTKELEPLPITPEQQQQLLLASICAAGPNVVPEGYAVLDFDSRRTNAAKAAHEQAVKDGLIPVLSGEFEQLTRQAESIRKSRLFQDLYRHPRTTALEWHEREVHGVTIRARPALTCRADDEDPERRTDIVIVQSVSRIDEVHYVVNKARWDRKAAFYGLAARAPNCRLFVVEQSPPFSVQAFFADPVGQVQPFEQVIALLTRMSEEADMEDWERLIRPETYCPLDVPAWDR